LVNEHRPIDHTFVGGNIRRDDAEWRQHAIRDRESQGRLVGEAARLGRGL